MTPATRRVLRARAHKLEPVVIIGGKGLTGEVIAEIDRALTAHELIKVRGGGFDRLELKKAFEEICEKTGAQPVQRIGKVLVLYRKCDTPKA